MIGGFLWFSFHAAHTSFYAPFPVGMTARGEVALPEGYTKNDVGRTDRGVGAWQAAHYVYSAAQLNFGKAFRTIRSAQQTWEGSGEALVAASASAFLNGSATIDDIGRWCCHHATSVVQAWWDLSDELLRDFIYPSATYPDWWLQATNYIEGPPPSPEVPPPPTTV